MPNAALESVFSALLVSDSLLVEFQRNLQMLSPGSSIRLLEFEAPRLNLIVIRNAGTAWYPVNMNPRHQLLNTYVVVQETGEIVYVGQQE